jgi:hypothetical protein
VALIWDRVGMNSVTFGFLSGDCEAVYMDDHQPQAVKLGLFFCFFRSHTEL